MPTDSDRPAEKRIAQVPLTADEFAMLCAFAGIGATLVNATELDLKGDLQNAARARHAGAEVSSYAIRALEADVFNWDRWRALNRRMATLARAAFPETPVVWRGDARAEDAPRPT